MHYSNKMSLASSSSTQRNQKHFFLFFLVVAGGRTGCGESCWWGVVAWGVEGCGEPSGGSPTFHVRTTCPSCRRKSCSTLERKRNNAVQCYLSVFKPSVIDFTWSNIHSLLAVILVSTSSCGKYLAL